jgi:hypothetical protein
MKFNPLVFLISLTSVQGKYELGVNCFTKRGCKITSLLIVVLATILTILLVWHLLYIEFILWTVGVQNGIEG